MRSGSSLEQRNIVRSRLRKKHKKLDAICEEEYNRNHGEFNEDDVALNNDAGVRRSSRVQRAPILLDASPPPRKKQRRLGKNGMQRGLEGVKSLERENGSSSGGAESPGTWSSRLRSRDRNVGFEVKEERELPPGNRKLFEGVAGSRGDEELEVMEVDNKEESDGSMPKIVNSKRPGRIKATRSESHGSLDESKSQEVELVLDKDEESASVPENELSGGNLKDILDGNAHPTKGTGERNVSNNLQTEDYGAGIEPSPVEHVNKQDDQLESVEEGSNASVVVEIASDKTSRI